MKNLAKYTLLCIYLVILFGGATRVWEAGVSCPDWPKCYGAWFPFPESHVIAATGAGYFVDGVHYTAFQVFLEWGHRLLAAIAGFLILALTVLTFKHSTKAAKSVAILSLVILLAQVKLGGVTVIFKNVPWSVALHLGNAMLLFAAVVWWRRLLLLPATLQPILATPAFIKGVFIAFSATVFVTMCVGATMSSAYAGGVCGGLPNCAGLWWPEDTLQQIHMLHRMLGVSVLALSIALVFLCKRHAPHLRSTVSGLRVLVLGQVLLGVITLYSFSSLAHIYHALSIAHLGWGTLLWMASIGALLRIKHGKNGTFHA